MIGFGSKKFDIRVIVVVIDYYDFLLLAFHPEVRFEGRKGVSFLNGDANGLSREVEQDRLCQTKSLPETQNRTRATKLTASSQHGAVSRVSYKQRPL